VIDSLQLNRQAQSRNAGELAAGRQCDHRRLGLDDEAKETYPGRVGVTQALHPDRAAAELIYGVRAGTLKRRWVTDGDAITLVAFEAERFDSESVEERRTPAQEHGRDVNLELVEQPRLQGLLDDACPTGQMDVLSPAAARACSTRPRCRPVTNVNEVSPSMSSVSRGVMGQHEHRHVERRILSHQPWCARIVLPTALTAAEHLSPHHDSAGGAKSILR